MKDEDELTRLYVDRHIAHDDSAMSRRVGLPAQTLASPEGIHSIFDIGSFSQRCLPEVSDDIGLPPQYDAAITAFGHACRAPFVWFFSSPSKKP